MFVSSKFEYVLPKKRSFFVSIVCMCSVMNARPFSSVAFFSTAIDGCCFNYVIICFSVRLSFLLLCVRFVVLITCLLYFCGSFFVQNRKCTNCCAGNNVASGNNSYYFHFPFYVCKFQWIAVT